MTLLCLSILSVYLPHTDQKFHLPGCCYVRPNKSVIVYRNLVKKDPNFPYFRGKGTAFKWQHSNKYYGKYNMIRHNRIWANTPQNKNSLFFNPLFPLNLLLRFLTKVHMFFRDSVFYALLEISPSDVVTFPMMCKVLRAWCWVHNAINGLGSISLWDLLALHHHGSLCFSWPCLPLCSSP